VSFDGWFSATGEKKKVRKKEEGFSLRRKRNEGKKKSMGMNRKHFPGHQKGGGLLTRRRAKVPAPNSFVGKKGKNLRSEKRKEGMLPRKGEKKRDARFKERKKRRERNFFKFPGGEGRRRAAREDALFSRIIRGGREYGAS